MEWLLLGGLAYLGWKGWDAWNTPVIDIIEEEAVDRALFSDTDDMALEVNESDDCPSFNPASGLPMIGCAVDIEGNPYGTDLHNSGSDAHNFSSLDEDFSSGYSSFNDYDDSFTDSFSDSSTFDDNGFSIFDDW